MQVNSYCVRAKLRFCLQKTTLIERTPSVLYNVQIRVVHCFVMFYAAVCTSWICPVDFALYESTLLHAGPNFKNIQCTKNTPHKD